MAVKGLRFAKYSGSVLTNQYLYNLSGGMIAELDGSANWVRGEIYAGGTYIGTYDNSTTTFGLSDWLGNVRYRANLDGGAAETCTNLPFGAGRTWWGCALACRGCGPLPSWRMTVSAGCGRPSSSSGKAVTWPL